MKFFITVFLIWGSLHFYFYVKLASALSLNAPWRTALGVSLAILSLLYLGGRLLAYSSDSLFSTALTVSGAVWMGSAALLFTTMAIFDIAVSLPATALAKAGLIGAGTCKSVQNVGIITVLGISALLSLVSLYCGLKTPEVKSVEVKIAGLDPEMSGFRIVQLCDIHIGGMISRAKVAEIVEVANSLNPDIVILSGDIVDEPYERIAEKMKLLCEFKAGHGIYATMGNHEHYAGSAAIEKGFEACGIKILRQGHAVIKDSLVLAGIDDPVFLGGRENIPAAIKKSLTGKPPSLPVVLISHQPVGVEAAAESGVSLMLSGHTHGGQIPPMHLNPLIAYGYLAGDYEVGGMRLYVNSGAAYWGPPMRLLAPKEILLVVLKRL